MINWFNKLTSGLKTTSDKLSGGISDIFTKRKVDAQTLEELEAIRERRRTMKNGYGLLRKRA